MALVFRIFFSIFQIYSNEKIEIIFIPPISIYRSNTCVIYVLHCPYHNSVLNSVCSSYIGSVEYIPQENTGIPVPR